MGEEGDYKPLNPPHGYTPATDHLTGSRAVEECPRLTANIDDQVFRAVAVIITDIGFQYLLFPVKKSHNSGMWFTQGVSISPLPHG